MQALAALAVVALVPVAGILPAAESCCASGACPMMANEPSPAPCHEEIGTTVEGCCSPTVAPAAVPVMRPGLLLLTAAARVTPASIRTDLDFVSGVSLSGRPVVRTTGVHLFTLFNSYLI